jgi:outer membrane lipopolysaccharide assembly protein LptE/RlpB
MKSINLLILTIILFSATLGCGYHIMGKGGEFPEGITSLAILPLENKTKEPNLTAIFVSALHHEFIFRREVEIVTEKKAQASLQGTITSISINSTAYNPEGRATEYQVTITLDLRLIRQENGAILWRGDGIKGSWNYKTLTSTPTDIMVNEGNKNSAIHKIAADLAEKIYIMIKERF